MLDYLWTCGICGKAELHWKPLREREKSGKSPEIMIPVDHLSQEEVDAGRYNSKDMAKRRPLDDLHGVAPLTPGVLPRRAGPRDQHGQCPEG
jgi:hypothetical protein